MTMNNLKISTRLSLSFGLVLSITVLLAGVGISRLDTLKAANHEIATTGAARSALAKQWMANIHLNALRLSVALKSSDAAANEALQRDIAATTAATSEIQKSLGALNHDDEGRRLLAEIAANRANYLDKRAALSARKKSGEDVSQAVDREMDPVAAVFLASLGRLVEHAEAQLRQGEAEVRAMATTSQWLLGVGAAAALLMDLVFGATIVRSIVRQLGAEPGDAARLAQGVAGGSLGTPIHLRPGDTTSLMAQLKAMQDSLVQVVSNVRRNSESVATASAQIAQGNNDLSSRTEQQASALEETAASMEQLSSTVKQNADNAHQANQLALGASSVALRGGEVVGLVVATTRCRTSPRAATPNRPCAPPSSRPRRPTSPRASSWPT
jgi:methyl-accepting chemotaxis protein